MLRGPDLPGNAPHAPAPLPAAVLQSVVSRALEADTTLALRDCRSEQELLEALCVADHDPADVVLLAPGACVSSERLRRLLPRLRNAYVEVHDDAADTPPEQLPENAGRRLAVARGCGAQSYVLALEVALEHLACSEAGERVHVGT
ncbi:MAG: 3-dehydroquinate dehydratase [Stenotrophomonas acidaminiphila]|nr:3-dehydroquinate dehydratase [Stenotrophomonas acidaminiphila]